MEYGIATRQNATRSIDTRILGRDPVDPAVGHDFWAQRSGTGRTDKQSGYLVEFECVCGTFCDSMTWASAGYHQGPHFINGSGVGASCGQCHIPYDSSHAAATEYVKMLLFKAARGAKDFWNESHKTIATREEWEKRRPQLGAEFDSYLQAHNYITCRGCHVLDAFGGPRSQMKVLIHKDIIKANDVGCLRCHRDVGHVYEQPVAKVGGWYTTEQAGSGEKKTTGSLEF